MTIEKNENYENNPGKADIMHYVGGEFENKKKKN